MATASEPQALTDFRTAIAPVESAYCGAVVRYIAGRKGREQPWSLLHAHVLLVPRGERIESLTFSTDHIRAGVFSYSGEHSCAAALIKTLLAGEFPVEDGTIQFAPRDEGTFDFYHLKAYPGRDTNLTNCTGLRFDGGWIQTAANVHDVGWELLGGTPPYESLQDLATEYGLGPLQHHSRVELWTAPVLHFTDDTSVGGEIATIGIQLAGQLNPEQVSLGLKMQSGMGDRQGAPLLLNWTTEAEGHRAIASIPVPKNREILCSLRFAGITQAFAILCERASASNPRRALYEIADPNLGTLKSLLADCAVSEQNSPQFELLVVRLFWLAGFDVLHVAGDKRTQRATDILATTPEGRILVVECTTTVLKKDKRSQLLRRAQMARDALDQSSASVTVVPLIVTCLPTRHIEADAEQSWGDGIGVFSYEDLSLLLNQSSHLPNPADLYSAIQQRLDAAALLKRGTGDEWS